MNTQDNLQDRLQSLFPVHYRSGNILLINADCHEVMKHIKDREIELCITDPPYFNGPDKLGYYGNVISSTKVKRQSYLIIEKWEVPQQNYFNAVSRVSKEQIIWGVNYFSIQNPGVGRIIWDKVNDSSTFSDGEIAYCSLISTVRFFRFMWNGMLQENMKNKEFRIHPTQKPVRLYEWLLKNYAKTGDKILDTHGGSFSLAIACYNLDFEFTGIELDVEYFKAAVERFEEHKKQQRLFNSIGGNNA
jgi:site-specific DNA-methyltransferase (adenine-specific)